MKSKVMPMMATAALLLAFGTVQAQTTQATRTTQATQTTQTTQAAPTGQVPKAYTGVHSAPATSFKPKPTGQIAPEAPGQLGTIVQPAPATAPEQKVSEVQDLGFEVNSRPSTQKDKTQKAASSQDTRTTTQPVQQTTQSVQTTTPKAASQRTDPQ